ncbi:pirin family protein [Pseudonocardia bannensis]|uniref:Pirin family protein n=1 Tax=Pseudonocardia bannensis TaxID=630973 RepID=A0A848DGF0_9PSEU|nr:pirin-like bicupin family protein [Pseudonocardia bannensis]NMH91624.1 pirin family protein [Pseudonocardia bannensis]
MTQQRSTTLVPSTDIRRAGDRAHTGIGWLDSRHSFSFGHHYDPANTHFGLLLVSNDDVVRAGTGFETHPHRDMEIVTWVLEGSLVHQDSTGRSGLIYPGLAQRMSAGSGILHSEKNDSWRLDGAAPRHDDDVHFVQMWVVPDTEGITPGYEQLDISGPLDSGDLVVVASGMPRHADDRAISIRQQHAALYAARLRPAGATALPNAPLVHLFVARGSVDLEGAGSLHTGDAARVTVSDGQRITAGADGAEVLVWEMHSTIA